ncbi:MAG: alpha-galactosidase [Thermoprotei archaeon]|nr:alpha-galactosidase [Thermoprotei archaeon]
MVLFEKGDVTISVDDLRGTLDISYKGMPRIEEASLLVKVDGRFLSSITRALRFKGAKAFEGGDDYMNLALRYQLGDTVLECKGMLWVYRDSSIYIELENGLNRPPLEDPVATLRIRDVPYFSSALCSCNYRSRELIAKAFRYYTRGLAMGTEPRCEPPEDNPPYPAGIMGAEPVGPGKLEYSPPAYPVMLRDWRSVPPFTSFLLMRYRDDMKVALISVCHEGVRSFIRGNGRSLYVDAISHHPYRTYARIPLAVIAFDEDPYRAVEKAYSTYVSISKSTKLRKDKPYPAVFEYLGWCSWNAFLNDVDEKGLLEIAREFNEKRVPVRFFLIDAGWQHTSDNRLMSFDADREKFPRGLEATVKELKEKYSVKYVGVWHTLQGFWAGLDPESFKDYPLMEGSDGRWVPDPRDLRCFKFYFDYYDVLRRAGIDFIKVDNQYDIAKYVEGKMPIGEAAKALLYAMQSAAKCHGFAVINCMCMAPEDFYHWLSTNVSRVCMDYIPMWKGGAKLHLMYCAYNSLWYSQLTTPDYDMFQSHDPYARPHALMRAISGGPIYLTDRPGMVNAELARKLAFSDGRIPRPDRPALPTEDCIFRDPYNESYPLKVFNRVKDVGLIAVFNINKDGVKEKAIISPKDAMLDEDKRYAVYRYFGGRLDVIEGTGNIEVELDELDCELLIISPIVNGFAPIGIIDVFIAPKAIRDVRYRDGTLEIDLVEGGTFLAYIEREVDKVLVNGKAHAFSVEEGLLSILLPKELRNPRITIIIKD